MKRKLPHLLAGLIPFLLLSLSGPRARAQVDVYANQLISSSTDFQYPGRAVDTSFSNYAYISNELTLLNTSFLRVQFPGEHQAGEVVNVLVRGSSSLLATSLLPNITLRLYNSAGTEVASASGTSLLRLSLLSPGSNIYAIRYFTSIADTFHFTQVRLEMNSLLSLSLLTQFRVYGFYLQQPCPPVYAAQVHSYGTNGPLLTGYVNNAANAADANPNNAATLVMPLSLLSLLPPAFIDLQFDVSAKAGDYVGVTVNEASTLLSLALLSKLRVELYDEAGTMRESRTGFTLANLKLLSGTTDRYTIGFLSQNGSYKIKRLRFILDPAVGLLQNINIFNAFHYRIDRPAVTVSVSGPTTFCQGGSVTLTATDSMGMTNYQWSNGATGSSVTVTQSGTYTVEVLDSASCSRRSIPIAIVVLPRPQVTIQGDSVLCLGASGTLSVNGSFAAYAWSNGSTNATIPVTQPAAYSVTVTDTNGCSNNDNIVVRNNNLLITPAIVNATCATGSNGSVALTVSGGSGNYAYRWSDGSTTGALNNVKPGLYTVRVTDNVYACTYQKAYSVVAANALSIKAAIINTSSCTSTDGQVNTQVIGGSGNYTYTWSNGSTTATAAQLAAGFHYLTVQDAVSGCQVKDTFLVVNGNSGLTITPNVTNTSSCNTANGSIALNITGGSGNYTYQWSTGGTGASVSGLAAGTYYVLVTDNTTLCKNGVEVNVTNTGALNVTAAATSSSCKGKTGSLTATVTGGSGNYSYLWSNGATGVAATGLQSGTYKLTVTDNTSGCTRTESFVVGETGGPVAVLTVTQPSCSSNGNGAITVAAAPGLRYQWSNGSAAANQSNLKPGTYALTVTDTLSGCSSNYSADLKTKEQILLTASPRSNTSCATAPNGAVNLVASAGVPPYTYSWSNGVTTQNIISLNAGTYTVSVQDAAGCQATMSVPVKTDSAKLLKATIGSVVKSSCNTAANGSVTVAVTGGATPYTYLWSNGATTQNLSNVLPGSYNLLVTDAVGCTRSLDAAVGIDSSNLLTVTLDSTRAAGCAGSLSGGVFISVSGGTAPYGYNWSNGASTQDISGIVAGTYHVTVTDVNNCSAQRTAIVPVSGGSISIAVDSFRRPTCTVSTDGKVFITPNGGVAPYSYMWSNGATTRNLLNLNPGTYTVTATDANGCPGQATVTLTVDTQATLKVALDSVSGAGCATGANGAVYITATSGTLPYTYNWSNSSTTSDLLNVIPGSYTVTVTDARGCVVSKNASIGIDNAKTPAASLDSVRGTGCAGSTSGAIFVTVTSGKAPFTYAWSNGATSQDLTNVATGSYSLAITDAAGCFANVSASIGIDPAKVVHAVLDSARGASCATAANGSIYVTASGGAAPYAYSWSNGATSQDLLNVIPGSYSVTVTDAYNCSASVNASLSVDTSRSVKVVAGSIIPAGCAGSTSGAINVQVSGGVVPYAFSWSNGASTQNISNVLPGSYTLNVTDAAGCAAQLNATVGIDLANPINASVTAVTDAKCTGSNSGSIDVTVTGGAPPYAYSWSNGAVTQDLNFVASGSYTLTTTDTKGCSVQLGVNVGISNANPVTVRIDSVLGVGCGDTASGKVFATASGGGLPYTFLWSNGTTAEDLINVPVGSYNLVVTDDYGCKATVSANVLKVSALAVDASGTNPKCYGENGGSVTTTVSNGTGLYQYQWSNGAGTANISNVGAGSYTVTVTDLNTLCSGKDSVTLVQPDSLRITLVTSGDSCLPGPDGSIQAVVGGGTPPYTYAWSNGRTDDRITGLATGLYSVVVKDNNQCSRQSSVKVGEAECDYSVVVHDVITPNGDGSNDVWVIRGIENYPKSKVKVFNKWGDIVFEKTGYTNNWRGTLKDSGTELPDGNYIYVVVLNEANRAGGKGEFTGTMLIQR